jgi:peptidyl-tRNA hydrolase, PTH2 family
MGASASVLSLPAASALPAAFTAVAGGFALGYLLALGRTPRHSAAPAAGGLSDEDSEEDDDENSARRRTAKRAGLRLLFWSRNVVTKSDSAREAERAQAHAAAVASPLEIENLAAIIQDFKMVWAGFGLCSLMIWGRGTKRVGFAVLIGARSEE